MFKEKLMTALKDAVSFRQGGESDTASVVKAASAHDFNDDQTARLLETYNTAKTAFMLSKGEARDSVYTLAEPSGVKKALQATKTAAAEPQYDYGYYERPEHYEPHGEPLVEKVADEACPEWLEGVDGDTLIHTAMSNIAAIRSEADLIKSALDGADLSASEGLRKIAATLEGEYGSPAWSDVQLHCYEEYPTKIAEDLESRLRTLLPDKDLPDLNPLTRGNITMLASTHPKVAIDLGHAARLLQDASTLRELSDPDDLYKTAADLDASLAVSLDLPDPGSTEVHGGDFLSDRFIKSASSKDSNGVITQESFDELIPDRAARLQEWGTPHVKNVGAGLSSAIGGVSGAVGRQAGAAMGSVSKALISQQQRAMEDARDRLANTRRQLMLENLLTTDPVLKGQDPERLVAAYQAIREMSPTVSMNQEVVRAVLRTASQSDAFSPYDAKSLADLEKVIRQATSAQVPMGAK